MHPIIWLGGAGMPHLYSSVVVFLLVLVPQISKADTLTITSTHPTSVCISFEKAKMANRFAVDPGDHSSLESLRDALRVARSLPFPVILWSIQNRVYEVFQRSYKRIAGKAARQDVAAATWISTFRSLAALAEVRLD